MSNHAIQDAGPTSQPRDQSHDRKNSDIVGRIFQSVPLPSLHLGHELVPNNLRNSTAAPPQSFTSSLSATGPVTMSLAPSRGGAVLQPAAQHTLAPRTPPVLTGRVESIGVQAAPGSAALLSPTVIHGSTLASLAAEPQGSAGSFGSAGTKVLYPLTHIKTLSGLSSGGSGAGVQGAPHVLPTAVSSGLQTVGGTLSVTGGALQGPHAAFTLVRPLHVGGGQVLPGGVSVAGLMGGAPSLMSAGSEQVLGTQMAIQLTAVPAPARFASNPLPARLQGAPRAAGGLGGAEGGPNWKPVHSHVPRGASVAAATLTGPKGATGMVALARSAHVAPAHTAPIQAVGVGTNPLTSANPGVAHFQGSRVIMPVRPTTAANSRFRVAEQAVQGSSTPVQIAIQPGRQPGASGTSTGPDTQPARTILQPHQVRALTAQHLALHTGGAVLHTGGAMLHTGGAVHTGGATLHTGGAALHTSGAVPGSAPIRGVLATTVAPPVAVLPAAAAALHVQTSVTAAPTLFPANRLEGLASQRSTAQQQQLTSAALHSLHGGTSSAGTLLSVSGAAALMSAGAMLHGGVQVSGATFLGATQVAAGHSSGPRKLVLNAPHLSAKPHNLPIGSLATSRSGKDGNIQPGPLNLSQSGVRGGPKGVRPHVVASTAPLYPGGGHSQGGGGGHHGQGAALLSAINPKSGGPQVMSLATLGFASPLTTNAPALSVATLPIAKVTPQQGHMLQSLSSETVAAVRSSLQQQQRQRQQVAVVSQAILQQSMFLSATGAGVSGLGGVGGAAYATVPQQSLALPQMDIRGQGQHGADRLPVLHQLTVGEGAKLYGAPHLLNYSSASNYGLPLVAFPAASLRPAPASSGSHQSLLSAGLIPAAAQASSMSSGLSAATALRLNPPVVMAMDAGRHPTLSLQSYAAANESRFLADTLGAVAIGSHQPTSAGFAALQPTVIALMQPPQQQLLQQQQQQTADGQPTMSPRPSILRKRHHESTAAMAPKSLLSSLTSVTIPSSVSMPDSRISASPRSLDGSRENSQSSTDTASSAESTPRCSIALPPHAASSTAAVVGVERIKKEPADSLLENGMTLHTGQRTDFSGIPRKKPRKQSLHVQEEVQPGSALSSDDGAARGDDDDSLSVDLFDSDDLADDSLLEDPPEHVDAEGVRWMREPPSPSLSIIGSYHCSWKPRHNHFVSFADIKPKEERRPTINELANSKNILQRVNAWRPEHLAAQLEMLIASERRTLDEVRVVQSQCSAAVRPGSRHSAVDDELRAVREVTQADVQRSQLYMDQLTEARGLVLRLGEARQRAIDVISRHQSKRTVKKKDRS